MLGISVLFSNRSVCISDIVVTAVVDVGVVFRERIVFFRWLAVDLICIDQLLIRRC